MHKIKSASLSEKDQKRIVDIVHAKMTPLRFKYKSLRKDPNFLSKQFKGLNHQSLPRFRRLNEQSPKDQSKVNQIISILAFINSNLQKNKIQNQWGQMRHSVLDTQYIAQEEQIINLQMNQTSQNQNPLHPSICPKLTEYQKSKRLANQLLILQKKKMLKSVKLQIKKRKEKLCQQIAQKQKQYRERQALYKKYNPQAKDLYKRISYKIMKNHQIFQSLIMAKSQQKNQKEEDNQQMGKQNIEPISLSEQIQNKYSNQTEKEKNDAMILKEYINFFKQDARQNRKSNLPINYRFVNQQASELLNEHSKAAFQGDIPYHNRRLSDIQHRFSALENNPATKHRNEMIYFKGKTLILGQKDANLDKQKQISQQNENQPTRPSLINAKMRMRSNHKKMVNIAKSQKAFLTKEANVRE